MRNVLLDYPLPLASQTPLLYDTHNHAQIQEVTVHVFAMADRKRFKEWGKGSRKIETQTERKKHAGRLLEKSQIERHTCKRERHTFIVKVCFSLCAVPCLSLDWQGQNEPVLLLVLSPCPHHSIDTPSQKPPDLAVSLCAMSPEL